MKCVNVGVMRSLMIMMGMMLASSAAWAAGWSGATTIKEVEVVSGNYIWVVPSSSFQNPDSCGASTGVMLMYNSADYQTNYATILAAFTAGATIEFWVGGCNATEWGYTAPVIQDTEVSQ